MFTKHTYLVVNFTASWYSSIQFLNWSVLKSVNVRIFCNDMSSKMLKAFSRTQNMFFSIKLSSSRKPPSSLHRQQFAYYGRQKDSSDDDAASDQAEIDTTASYELLISKQVLTRDNSNCAGKLMNHEVKNAELLEVGDEKESNKEEEAEIETEGELAPRKTFYRAKQLVTILKKKQEEIYKEFTLRHRKRYYTLDDGIFYEFSSSKEIIINEDAILKSKNQRNILNLMKSKKETRRDYISYQKLEKTPVIVILGHFNHGKTTLLDSLGNFSIVDKEAHGITQVNKLNYL